jgi:hypothetical protein
MMVCESQLPLLFLERVLEVATAAATLLILTTPAVWLHNAVNDALKGIAIGGLIYFPFLFGLIGG